MPGTHHACLRASDICLQTHKVQEWLEIATGVSQDCESSQCPSHILWGRQLHCEQPGWLPLHTLLVLLRKRFVLR